MMGWRASDGTVYSSESMDISLSVHNECKVSHAFGASSFKVEIP
jgi:hypothetical protein